MDSFKKCTTSNYLYTDYKWLKINCTGSIDPFSAEGDHHSLKYVSFSNFENKTKKDCFTTFPLKPIMLFYLIKQVKVDLFLKWSGLVMNCRMGSSHFNGSVGGPPPENIRTIAFLVENIFPRIHLSEQGQLK